MGTPFLREHYVDLDATSNVIGIAKSKVVWERDMGLRGVKLGGRNGRGENRRRKWKEKIEDKKSLKLTKLITNIMIDQLTYHCLV